MAIYIYVAIAGYIAIYPTSALCLMQCIYDIIYIVIIVTYIRDNTCIDHMGISKFDMHTHCTVNNE